jgi:hypothetical protein
MPYPLLPSARRQGQIEGQAQLTAPASLICVHAAIDSADKLPAKSYRVECYVSSDASNWIFMGGGEHASLGPKIKRGVSRERQDPRLRIGLQSPLPSGTWVRAVCNIPSAISLSLEIETDAELSSTKPPVERDR